MADKSLFDSRPSQISKDMPASDNSIPLSPQWLLSKMDDSKTGTNAGDNHMSPYSGDLGHSSILKSPRGSGEIHDTMKKKDVFRPSVLDMESGRRDRWHDEEREPNSYVRRDRWREGDREVGDSRRLDRWTESSGKHFEARRAPFVGSSERWSDSSNKDANYEQRREGKWTTRWGPDDKEADSSREKWTDSKEVDTPLHGKEEEGDNHRPWRSSLSHARGKVEPSHQTPTGNKHISMYAHGRGRGENSFSTFSLGRGKANVGGVSLNNATTQPLLSYPASQKDEHGHGEQYPLKYNRTKLLDVYRLMDMRSCKKLIDGVVQVASITLEEPLDPLALCAPTPEELDILKGIDKGDIVGSGAPQITKDGSTGKNSVDFMQSRRSRLGGREDLQAPANYNREEIVDSFKAHMQSSDHSLSHEASREDGSCKRKDDVPINRESSLQGNSNSHHGALWRSPSISDRSISASHDSRDAPSDIRPKTSDVGWTQLQKDLNIEWENSLADSSYSKERPKWGIVDDPVIRRQHSLVMDGEQGIAKLQTQSPEDMLLCYKDPQGEIQGPFTGSDIIGWFEAGYFGIDLQVRHANAPRDSPFMLLGDAMPHLRAKARPPPGFGVPKHNEISDVPNRSNYGSFGKFQVGSSELDIVRNETRYGQSSTTEAENRFLESLMSGSISSSPLDKFSPSTGMHGYLKNNSGMMPTPESGDNTYLRAKQQMTLERQRSLPSPYSYWPGRDLPPVVPISDNFRDSVPLSKPASSFPDNPLQQPLSQNVDLLSVIQGLPAKSASGVNNVTSSWSTYPAQVGLDPRQDKFDRHQNLSAQVPFGIQPPVLQAQNQPVLADLLAQAIENPSALTPEKQLSAAHSHESQLLNLLQQQHLLQLHNQAPAQMQQLSALKILLLKQQQEQEEHQLRQQQQLLVQVLSEHHSKQHLGGISYGQFQGAGLPAGNTTLQPEFQQLHDLLHTGVQKQISTMEDNAASNIENLSTVVSKGLSHNFVSETSSVLLPHQMHGDVTHQKAESATLPEKLNDKLKSMSLESSVVDTFVSTEVHDKNRMEPLPSETIITDEPVSASMEEAVLSSKGIVNMSISMADSDVLQVTEKKSLLDVMVDQQEVEREEFNDKPSVTKEIKNAEVRQVKKEKKSKKQKSSKALSSDVATGVSITQHSKPLDVERTEIVEKGPEIYMVPQEELYGSSPKERKGRSNTVTTEMLDSKQGEHMATKYGAGQVGSVEHHTPQVPTAQRAWKPAPGFKPKSLLEIQQEEQRRAQADLPISSIPTVNSLGSSWTGLVASSDEKQIKECQQEAVANELNTVNPNISNQRSKKSQLHDLLTENNTTSSKKGIEITDGLSNSSSIHVLGSQFNSDDLDNFIDAKDTKKSRKKSAKAKGVGASTTSASLANVSVASSPAEKAKIFQQVEKEVLPAVPAGPSLGDFVVWRGEPANSPAPAWSADSGKLLKPTSLRDIQKEQERKLSSIQNQNAVPISQKPLPTEPSRGNSTWSIAGATSTKTSPVPTLTNSLASSQSKQKIDDDLFWGPLDQPKQDDKQLDFPHLANQSSLGNRSTPAKGSTGGSLGRQKSIGGRSGLLSSSPVSAQTSVKGKSVALSKHSEAMDFRDWCENECVRLIGTRDTSVLEFCLKQSRSEAEMLLIENIGPFDPDHKFISKFLDYKDLLPSDVLEIAFQTRNDQKLTKFGAGDVTSGSVGFGISEAGNTPVPEGSAKGVGKKKAKKGKKVSPSVLGFNVVSNRIMMGEIQTVED